MSDLNDFFAEMAELGADTVATSDMAEAARLVDQLRRVNAECEEAKERADRLGKQAHHLKTVVIPEALAKAGVGGMTLTDGTQVEVADFVAGSLPKDAARRDRAIAELAETGGEALIKTRVVVEFPRSGHNEALSLRAELEAQGYLATAASDVHPQTLAAFAREKLKNGEPINAEALGLFVGRTTKIKAPRG